ncbi:unnamed protein product [Caenorhabditis sp. 36 PRJEB53466]|nr:unnamed protein product [Caenorhabditis sp. 36 PRJEB53466]
MADIDFSTPRWLVNYYHLIGAVSLVLDAFSIYLILFKSSKIDNFRYFLLNFQIACSLTDIQLTLMMQPIPLYPLVAGFSVGLMPTHLGVSTQMCLVIVIFLMMYHISSMTFCFVRKHQAIADALKRFSLPNTLIFALFLFLVLFTSAVPGLMYTVGMTPEEQIDYIRENYPQYIPGFDSLQSFAIYDANIHFIAVVSFAVSGGLIVFLIFLLVLLNIFRMLRLLKRKISASNYRKHQTAIRSLVAQFATSSVFMVPSIFFYFVVLVGVPHAQVIVEFLLVLACLHSSLNALVLVITFPPYRKFVIHFVLRREDPVMLGLSVISAKPFIKYTGHE